MIKYYPPSETTAEDPQNRQTSIDREELCQDQPANVAATPPSTSIIPIKSGTRGTLRSSRIRWNDDVDPVATGSDERPNASAARQIKPAEIGSPEPANFKRPLLAGLITSAVVFSMVAAGAGLVAKHNGAESSILTQAAVQPQSDLPETRVLEKETARLPADDQDASRQPTFSTNVVAFSGLQPQIQMEAPSHSGQFQSAGTTTSSFSISSYASAQRFQADSAGGLSAISAAMGQNHQAISGIAQQQSAGADFETTAAASASLAGGEAEAAAVVTSDVNMREKASRKGKIIAVLPANTSIQLGACGKWWCEVGADGKQGFVSKRFVESGG